MSPLAARSPLATAAKWKATKRAVLPNMNVHLKSPMLKARKFLRESTPRTAAQKLAGMVNVTYDSPGKGAAFSGNLALELGAEITKPQKKGKSTAKFLNMNVMVNKPFSHNKITHEPLEVSGEGKHIKHVAMNRFKEAIRHTGNLEHQADLILTHSTKVEPDIGRSLGMV